MSAIRLTFLYPHFFRGIRLGEGATQYAKSRCRKPPGTIRSYTAAFTTSTKTKNAAFERHGKAVEPQPPHLLDGVKIPGPAGRGKDAPVERGTDEVKDHEDKADTTPPDSAGAPKPGQPTPQQAAAEEKMQSSGPLDAVLHMPPPEHLHHPHISTPPYVHHFDSYTLVKQLEAGGYTKDQAITAMKAVRSLLAQNLDVAQEGLVSKSDVENETYLFRAACSELSTEIKNNRRVADEQMRQQRTLVQHEVDILTQKLTQDLTTLKDEVRGMFNDRKMEVREEQRRTEGAIQKVNLAISLSLGSDAKSDIEALRWVVVRRCVLGIVFMAVMTVGTIRYTSYVTHKMEKEAEKQAREEVERKKNYGREDNASSLEAAEILAAN